MFAIDYCGTVPIPRVFLPDLRIRLPGRLAVGPQDDLPVQIRAW